MWSILLELMLIRKERQIEQKIEEENLNYCILICEKKLYPKICYNRLYYNCTSQVANIIKTSQTECTAFCNRNIELNK